MSFLRSSTPEPVRLQLKRDRTRMLKQGYPWIFRDWLEEVPKAPIGSRALVRDRDGSLVAFGMFDPEGPISVRVVAVERERLGDELIAERLAGALSLRRLVMPPATTGFRLINGEGDGLPGLVCDLYGDSAVLKFDGDGPTAFWNAEGFAEWLVQNLGVRTVIQRFRGDEQPAMAVSGSLPERGIRFLEHGLTFEANLVKGQKTGFFFDQRENRNLIGKCSRGRAVLNLFGYTGGFSVYAGAGQAHRVTTVDLAKPAIEDANKNWALNGLKEADHEGVAADAFDYLAAAQKEQRRWGVVIVDPPSFASAERHVESAMQSYEKLFAMALGVTEPNGYVAFSSCSSHLTLDRFWEVSQGALSKARRRATVLGCYGQPEDHPFPFACEELRYLKFLLLRAA